LIVLGCVALGIALLPFIFLFGFFALAAVLFVAAYRGQRNHHPAAGPQQ